MEFIVYGYTIGNNVEFRLDSSTLHNDITGKSVHLRSTMSALLLYMLQRSFSGKFAISDQEILSEVWEKKGLRASGARLWQVVQGLKFKLMSIGLSEDIIWRVNHNSYAIDSHQFKPLYLARDINGPGDFNGEKSKKLFKKATMGIDSKNNE